jgi:hypothetical protein
MNTNQAMKKKKMCNLTREEVLEVKQLLRQIALKSMAVGTSEPRFQLALVL